MNFVALQMLGLILHWKCSINRMKAKLLVRGRGDYLSSDGQVVMQQEMLPVPDIMFQTLLFEMSKFLVHPLSWSSSVLQRGQIP